jgi:hypothetical protein
MAELFFWDPDRHGLPGDDEATIDFLERLFEIDEPSPTPKFLLATQKMALLSTTNDEFAKAFEGRSVWWQDPVHYVPKKGAVMVINFKGDENVYLMPLAAKAATQVGLVAFEENFDELHLPDSYRNK